jgi:hypothetical protein
MKMPVIMKRGSVTIGGEPIQVYGHARKKAAADPETSEKSCTNHNSDLLFAKSSSSITWHLVRVEYSLFTRAAN